MVDGELANDTSLNAGEVDEATLIPFSVTLELTIDAKDPSERNELQVVFL